MVGKSGLDKNHCISIGEIRPKKTKDLLVVSSKRGLKNFAKDPVSAQCGSSYLCTKFTDYLWMKITTSSVGMK